MIFSCEKCTDKAVMNLRKKIRVEQTFPFTSLLHHYFQLLSSDRHHIVPLAQKNTYKKASKIQKMDTAL